jgi:hypothetical protein
MSELQNETSQPPKPPAGPKTQWERFVAGWNETFPDKISLMIFCLIVIAALFLFGRVVIRMRQLFGF